MLNSWQLSAFGFAQICSWGTLYYSFPQIAVAMGDTLQWQRAEIYGALSVGLLLSAVAAIPVGMVIDKGHGRAVMTVGSILVGCLFLFWSQVDSLQGFYLIFAGIGLLQAFVLYTAVFAVVVRHCEEAKTREYVTTLTLWGGFASTLFIPLIEFMLAYMDWRSVVVVLGGINIFVCGALYSLLPKGDEGKKSTDSQKSDQAVTAGVARWAVSQPVFWALVLSVAAFSLLDNALRFHLYPMLIENELSRENVIFLLALLGPAQVLGRLGLRMFTSPSVAQIGRLALVLIPVALIIITFFPGNVMWLSVGVVVYGAAAGVMTIVYGLAVPELLTKRSYGLLNGMINVPSTVLRAFGPAVAAIIWASMGGYLPLMLLLIAIGAAACIAFVVATVMTPSPSTSFDGR